MRYASLILLIIGGLNWGLMGLFEFDLVAAIFGGQGAIFSRIVYTIVGIAALIEIYYLATRKRVDYRERSTIERRDRAA